jgi:uncharacterized protein YkwD
MNSLAHRDNILRPQFGRIGIGVFQSGGRSVFVQVFTN